MDKLFSNREGINSIVRSKDELTIKVYNEVLSIIRANIISLSQSYPERCYDNDNNIIGINWSQFINSLEAQIPGFKFLPKEQEKTNFYCDNDEDMKKETYLILDVVNGKYFCKKIVILNCCFFGKVNYT